MICIATSLLVGWKKCSLVQPKQPFNSHQHHGNIRSWKHNYQNGVQLIMHRTIRLAGYIGWPLSRPHEIPWLDTDFSSRGKQRLPGIECLPIRSTVVVSYKWKTGRGQIVNYLIVGVVTAGGTGCGVPLPSRLEGLGERCKLPSGVRGKTPAEKRVLEYLELEKTHLISLPLTFSIFPNHFGIPQLFQVFQVNGHPDPNPNPSPSPLTR